MILYEPGLAAHPRLAASGFVVILVTALVQLYAPDLSWLQVEESFAGAAAVLIIGFGSERVTVLCIFWLAGIASGVLARGGRVHWLGRTVVLSALALPVALTGHLSATYAGLCFATIALLAVCGRVTRELSYLLEEARWDADHDDLTGLSSRTAFRARLDLAGAQASEKAPAALLLIDLKNFGEVNKTRGHAAGDALLRSVATRLSDEVGPNDLVSRLGGDEFAVLTYLSDPNELGRRMLESLSRGGNELAVTACAGIAVAPSDGRDADALLRAGDIAQRVAKRSGSGSEISTYAGASLSGDGRRSAQEALARLIEGEGIMTVVQPIVDLASGTVHAYEALTRFQAGTTSSPLHWFSLAEEFGQRDALERACLKAALSLYRKRPQGVRLTVNLSAPVLLDPLTLGLFDGLDDLSDLIVEITEDTLVSNDDTLHNAAAPLRARGAELAIDDMGAGYSGLRQITSVHPRYLKLDRSLVMGIDQDPDRGALVSALVGYASHVGCLLVAEGVETCEELAALKELRVPLIQGYYLGRPAAPWPTVQMDMVDKPLPLPLPLPAPRSVAQIAH